MNYRIESAILYFIVSMNITSCKAYIKLFIGNDDRVHSDDGHHDQDKFKTRGSYTEKETR